MSNRWRRSLRFVGLVGVLWLGGFFSSSTPAQAAGPTGELIWGVHVSLANTWFDPAETPGIITPFMLLYALHDAMVKPMPGSPLAPSLAESWSVSPDGLAYDFALRRGATFHNGEPVTAEDVKFSFERYRGAAATSLKQRVSGVDVIDTRHVRFRLKEPWPDFSYPDIDGLFREQAADTDRRKREATLQRAQHLMYEKAMFAPIWELGSLNGVGPRVAESGLGVITGHAYSAPYEDLTFKPR